VPATLEVALRGNIVGLREALDLGGALGESRRRTILVQHREGAEHLPHRLVETRQLAALRGVAEERVQGLLDRAQARLDLGDDLRHQHALLRAARHLVEHRHRRGLLQRLALDDRLQPLVHQPGLLRELVAEIGEVLAAFSTSNVVAVSIATLSVRLPGALPIQAASVATSAAILASSGCLSSAARSRIWAVRSRKFAMLG
jgi:hypothetical protein